MCMSQSTSLSSVHPLTSLGSSGVCSSGRDHPQEDLGKRPLRDLEVGSGTIKQGILEFLIPGALSRRWGGHELQMASQTPSLMNMDKKFRMGPFKLRTQGKSQPSSFPSLSVLLTASTFPTSTQMKASYLAHRFDSMF